MRPALILLLACAAALALSALGDDDGQSGGGGPERDGVKVVDTTGHSVSEVPAKGTLTTETPASDIPKEEAPTIGSSTAADPAAEGRTAEEPAIVATVSPANEIPKEEAPTTEGSITAGPAAEGRTAELQAIVATTTAVETPAAVTSSPATTHSLPSTVLNLTTSVPSNGSLSGPGENSTYRPPTSTQLPDCFSCLIVQHSHLVLVNSSCELMGEFAGCLAKCRLALRPESSLVAAIDFYTAFKQQACKLSGCTERVTACFDAFAVYHEGFLSMSLRCGNISALAESLRCLAEEANSSPQCVLNPGIVTYFLRAGADYLCNKDLRCFDYGNIFEPLRNGSFVQYSSVTMARYTKRCPLRTGFNTEACGCVLSSQVDTISETNTSSGIATEQIRGTALSTESHLASSTVVDQVTSTYRPALTVPPSDCSKCLSGHHEALRSAEDPCSLVNDVSYCLSTCRPSVQPQSSLVSLADFYNTFRGANCFLPGCSTKASACFDSFSIWRVGLESMTFRCGNSSAYAQTASCLSQVANESPNCALNPNAMASYFLTAGSSYLCDQTQRCFDYGNVYEPLQGNKTVYVQYSAISGQRYQRLCPRGTVFSISDCVCVNS